ncbi:MULTISPECIES: UDP-N-acetylmuramoyl-L-alanyl-D-glutamate--2,6-diaminopimelate ligase [unclassified Bartonella]|uniref:UDP-N-acetylmuramoyl-L-alanyl-D-glutamate--2, 6-diaminopimelate ligase n=1 Tax=unclassified Bartonella TaxID=2645622 RepID=UPI00099AC323|nr:MULTISPECIES: UDP-N-acetylmuramoyl-L-alanyl-D-glutamate--2,6-diaminopimelate ligase [unclassified Bartonella]AQX18119.1 UDP-N-acetylmuramoylalanyl-D-glutamate--2,6-diaminopimelate ligase [Bartonella sp. A1379B]AQX22634.1 UDP-N-acetylmuramoylalanyl-D-glutamate--2,6-diaminopimelate ligase [Bartonella sp. 11B]AQX24083.1 UDP-N-acetylmuramoylalanyl-D-glutamate--2,6-diaminopimelate ligase [Bartonella sp. 114]AQX25083.1 UDP-N-acetylmuramoylalanyl-D-glutamate--2,6-diaminopimelate ligase [Bartonella 
MLLGELFIECIKDDCLASIEITGISADSRQVLPGYVFVALKGNQSDGKKYVNDAIQRGARVIITDNNFVFENLSIPVIHVLDVRHKLAIAAARFYNSQPETVVAVTGTSGKTSVVSFVRQIWEYIGFCAASIGTVGVVSPKRHDIGSLTTPDPVMLQRLLCEIANDEGVTHAAFEASSHGLDQCRIDGVHLAAAAFTNLGRDHMDYHKSIEHYFHAKMRLFHTLLPQDAPALIFADDVYSQKVIDTVRQAHRQVLTIGRTGKFITLNRVEHQRLKQRVECRMGNNIYTFDLPLAGDFQVTNALMAAGLAIATNAPPDMVFRSLEKLQGAPGRLELVGNTEDGAPVYVDYAHKPEALEQVLLSVRPFTQGRLILVFGCGGDRDQGKRALMGKIAGNKADIMIVTDDNPRTEAPEKIRKDILQAVPEAIEIADRGQAIEYAVGLLKAGDTLIVAGKGHENGQIIGQEIYPFSDRLKVIAALKERNK